MLESTEFLHSHQEVEELNNTICSLKKNLQVDNCIYQKEKTKEINKCVQNQEVLRKLYSSLQEKDKSQQIEMDKISQENENYKSQIENLKSVVANLQSMIEVQGDSQQSEQSDDLTTSDFEAITGPLQAEITRLTDEKKSLVDINKTLFKQIGDLKQERKDIESRLASEEKPITNSLLQKRIDSIPKMRDTIDAQNDQLGKKDDEIRCLKYKVNEFNQIQALIDQPQFDEMSQEISQYRKTEKDLQPTIQMLERESSLKDEKIAKMQEEIRQYKSMMGQEDFQTSNEMLQREKSEQTSKIARMCEEINQYKSMIEQLQVHDSVILESPIEALRRENSELKSQIGRLESTDYETRCNQLKSEVQILESDNKKKITKYMTEAKQLKNQQKKNDQKISDLEKFIEANVKNNAIENLNDQTPSQQVHKSSDLDVFFNYPLIDNRQIAILAYDYSYLTYSTQHGAVKRVINLKDKMNEIKQTQMPEVSISKDFNGYQVSFFKHRLGVMVTWNNKTSTKGFMLDN